MGLVDRILAAAHPTVDVPTWETELGHRDEFGPSKYGNYIVTSNLIYSAVQLRARRLATIPVRAYRGSDENRKLQSTGPVPDLLRHVNPFWTHQRLRRQTEQCLGLWGEAFWAVQKNRAGVPTDLWWVRSDKMHPVPHPEKYLAGFVYNPVSGGEPVTFAADEVVWFRYPNPLDEYAGLSPLAAARLAADSASDAMRSNRKMHTSGMQLGGIISPPKGTTFSTTQATELEQQLEQRLSGTDKAHRWAVLRFEAQAEQMAVTPRDAEWLGGLNFTVREVARAYGIPSPLLMDLEHATLANVREFDRMLWELALVPDEELFVAELREQLLPMFGRSARGVDHLEPDFTGVSALQESHTAVWDRERQQVESGLRTINEWRAAQGLPAVAWGDVWWAPVNKQPVDSAEGFVRDLNLDGIPDAEQGPDQEAAPDASARRRAELVAAANRSDEIRQAVDDSASALLAEVSTMFDEFTRNLEGGRRP